MPPEYEEIGEAWEKSHISGRWRLTSHEMLSLRAKVRQERKEHREYVQKWLAVVAPAIGAMIGLVGALIGLVAMVSSN